MANGNFVLAIQSVVSDWSDGNFVSQLSTHIMSPQGRQVTSLGVNDIFDDYFSVSLSSAGKGFMIATKDAKGVRTKVYNGNAWSDELFHDEPIDGLGNSHDLTQQDPNNNNSCVIS